MKYIRFLLIGIIISYLSIYNCYAFDKNYQYNYEITSVDFNGQTGSIAGWGILNAGIDDGTNNDKNGSPVLNRNLDSTNSNPYEYELRIYAVNISGDIKKDVKYIYGVNNTTKSISLYQAMCHKDVKVNGSYQCNYSKSPQYDKVNYHFEFNFDDFDNVLKYQNASYPNLEVNGYRFELIIRSTTDECKKNNNSLCQQVIPISFSEKIVSQNAKKYFDTSTYMEKVSFVANKAWLRTDRCSIGNYGEMIQRAGGIYKLLDTAYCSNLEMTYYKIDTGANVGWVPSSWIAPLKDSYTLMKSDVCNVDGNQLGFNGVTNNIAPRSCIDNVKLTDSDSSSCITDDNSKYYTFSCQDNIEIKFMPVKEKYYKNDEYDIKLEITSYVSCNGIFDNELFQNKFNSGNINTKNNLNVIKNNFHNFTMNDYDSSDISAYLEYTNQNNVKKRARLIYNGEITNVPFSNNNNFQFSKNYQTNKQVVLMKLETPINISDIDTSKEYNVVVTKLGYQKKSLAYYSCSIELLKPIYRSIDLEKPFIDNNRIIGENWQNSIFDFTGIINSNIWEKEPRYLFAISPKNVKKIKENNHMLGVNAYVGSACSIRNNEYYCPFLRNHEYFEEFIINK